MSGLSELGQLLHEEHFRILVAICGLENRIAGAAGDRPADPLDPEDQRLLQGLIASLDHVIVHHSFEEAVVFPLLRSEADGDASGDLATLLSREHGMIEPKSRHLRQLATELLGCAPDASAWKEFREAARELITEVMHHLEREELAIVQRLPWLLDAETDHELARRHAADGGESPRRSRYDGEPARQLSRPVAGTCSAAGRTPPVQAAARAAARRRATTLRASPRP